MHTYVPSNCPSTQTLNHKTFYAKDVHWFRSSFADKTGDQLLIMYIQIISVPVLRRWWLQSSRLKKIWPRFHSVSDGNIMYIQIISVPGLRRWLFQSSRMKTIWPSFPSVSQMVTIFNNTFGRLAQACSALQIFITLYVYFWFGEVFLNY